jgi:SAM-dependent methyltransferase
MASIAAFRRRVRQALGLVGVDATRAVDVVSQSPRFVRDAIAYQRANREASFPLRFDSILPVLSDAKESAGTASGQYFHQDLWAARKIFARKPARHVDVGSRVDGFVAHLLVFMPVEVIDIRGLSSDVDGLSFVQADATNLAGFADGSVDSISSLHAVEHFGLGRYGDPIDPQGWRHAMTALARVLAPGGRLYFSVPIGRERLVFNAHRIFSPRTPLGAVPSLRLVSFSAVDDDGHLVTDADPEQFKDAHNSCGLFEFTK